MRVLIVDDDNLVAMSLKTILSSDSEIEVVATGSDGAEAIKLYEEENPDVLLMDIRMSGMSGLDAGAEILSKHKDARILYLTTFNDDEYIIKAISIGAKGYIIKQDFDGILPALRALMKPQGELVCLIKPQFEAGKEKVGKKGVVRDRKVHLEVLEQFLRHAGECGFYVKELTYSPIRGPEGNIEYLGHLTVAEQPPYEGDLAALVEESHARLEAMAQ